MSFILIYFITQIVDISFWISRDIDNLYLFYREKLHDLRQNITSFAITADL